MTAAVRFLVAAAVTLSVMAARADERPTAQDVESYKHFRIWFTTNSTPDEQNAAERDPAVAGRAFDRWAEAARQKGAKPDELARDLAVLKKFGIKRLEVEAWNTILTTSEGKSRFNTAPNAFLVEMVKGRKPGRALDVGMGQGRNALWLAQQGWDVTGFDPADKALAAADAEARRLGVAARLHTVVAEAEAFDWGKAKWDLIVISYAGGREHVADVLRSLKPGGLVVLEAFKAQKGLPAGGDVLFGDNELLRLFGNLRVLRYEDTVGKSDFGLRETGLVRLLAQKPE